MESVVIPKKFEIRFRLTGENQYTGALLIDGMQMGVGTPKSLDEIVAFLMPEGRGMSGDIPATHADT